MRFLKIAISSAVGMGHQLFSQFQATSQPYPQIYIYILDLPGYLFLPTTLWQFNIAIEHGPFITDLPIKDGDFS